ncbi:hypothetical protein N7540_002622 [Penicillium herquei]|nr:hypothetical protein N7540_002622 [Penicillium herquei]
METKKRLNEALREGKQEANMFLRLVDENQCDGASPCSPCLLYGRDCDREGVDMRRRMAKYPAASVRESLEFLQETDLHDTIR